MARKDTQPTRGLIDLAAAVDARLHELGEIDLNQSRNNYPSCCGDSNGYYPSLYIGSLNSAEVMKLPKSGEATIKYKVRSASVNYDNTGNASYSTSIDVHSINADGKKDGSDGSDGSDEGATEFEAILARYEFGDRVRDPGGRFAPGTEVSTDDMVAAYGAAPKKKKKVLPAGQVQAVTGGVVP